MPINIAIEYDQLLSWLRQLPKAQQQQLMTEMWTTDNEPQTESSKSHLDAFAFQGILRLSKDPLTIQKEMRNEWE